MKGGIYNDRAWIETYDITVETETGKVVKVVDENGNKATEVTPKELEEIYLSKDGFGHIGLVLHAHSSPG